MIHLALVASMIPYLTVVRIIKLGVGGTCPSYLLKIVSLVTEGS
jgi:hypothetical protein